MRSKEKAHDYRYFPEPDLLPVHVSAAWREEIRRALPELPDAKQQRFVANYGLSRDEATVLTDSQQYADFFETVVKHGADPKQTAAWMQRLSYLAEKTAEDQQIVAERFGNVAATHFAEMIGLVAHGKITAMNARTVLAEMYETGKPPAEIIATKGFAQISDTSAIEQAAREVIAKNPDSVAKYKSGNEGVFKFFVGQVMKATRGQANPQAVNDILRGLLS
jgi:aspartyl-tRNA(Asn)/glutamyl-tRNA(Gln) amidotransferase subunit B